MCRGHMLLLILTKKNCKKQMKNSVEIKNNQEKMRNGKVKINGKATIITLIDGLI